MDNENKNELKQYLETNYTQLQDYEIEQFMKSHPWISEEKDKKIIDDYLKNYIQGLSERYSQLLTQIQQKIQKDQIPEEKQQNSETINNQNSPVKNNQQEDKKKEIEQIIQEKIQVIQLFFEEEKAQQEFGKHLYYIYQNLNIIFNDNSQRQLQITKSNFQIPDFIIGIFQELGYTIIDQNNNVCELGYFEENLINIEKILKFLQINYSQYLVNNEPYQQQQKQKNNSQQSQAIQDRLYYQFQAMQRRQQQQGYQNQTMEQEQQSYYDQQKEYRQNKKNDFQDNQKFSGNNVMTIEKLYQKNEDIFQQPVQNGFSSRIVTMDEIEKKVISEKIVQFGKLALDLTNKFRQQNKLSKLEWSQELCNIGMPHSRNMGEQKVPFGHQGFDQRASAIQFQHRGVYENVAYCTEGYSDIPKTIVDGWINSPGHRKNMLSDSNVCGIAVYRSSDNKWYFTQLLAKKV